MKDTMFTQTYQMKQFKKVYIIRDNSITNEPCNYYFEGTEDLNPTKEVIHGTSFHQAPSVFLHWMKKLEHTEYACGLMLDTRAIKPEEALTRLREGDTISVPNRFVLHLTAEWYGELLAKGVQVVIDHSYECDAFWYFGRLFKYLKQQGVLPNKNLKLLIGSVAKNNKLMFELQKEFGCDIIDTDFFRMYEAWFQSGQFYDDRHFPMKLPIQFDPADLDIPKSHTFLNLNRYCKPARYALVEYCRLKGYTNDAIISARWSTSTKDDIEFNDNIAQFISDLDSGASWFHELAGDLGINTFNIISTLDKHYPIRAEEELDSIYQTDRHNNKDWYEQSFYSLVSESYFDDYIVCHTGPSDFKIDPYDLLFVTEKTYKPIYCGHPFIICGQAGTLAHLKSLGFETFDNLFDETYDTIQDRHLRFKAVCEQIDNFEMSLHYDHITKEKIIHNRNHMLDTTIVKNITTKLLKRLQWL